MKGYKQLVVVGVLILVVAVISGFVGYAVGKGSSKTWGSSRRQITRMMRADFPPELSRAEKIEKFKKLYRENPEEFKRVLQQRGKMIRQRLARLKEEDPEKYREIIQKQINRLGAGLERLKQELPKTTQ